MIEPIVIAVLMTAIVVAVLLLSKRYAHQVRLCSTWRQFAMDLDDEKQHLQGEVSTLKGRLKATKDHRKRLQKSFELEKEWLQV